MELLPTRRHNIELFIYTYNLGVRTERLALEVDAEWRLDYYNNNRIDGATYIVADRDIDTGTEVVTPTSDIDEGIANARTTAHFEAIDRLREFSPSS